MSRKQAKQPVSKPVDPIPAKAEVRPADVPNDPLKVKEQLLHWIFSILGSLGVYAIVALVVHAVYHPDVEALKAEAESILLIPNLAYPKPVETLLFRLGVVTVFPGLIGFYILFSKAGRIKRLAQQQFFSVVSIILIAGIVALIWFDFAAMNSKGTGRRYPVLEEGVVDSNFNFLFDGFFIGNYLWLYVLLVLPLVCYLFFWGFKKIHWDEKKNFKRIVALGYIVLGIVIFAIVAMNTFHFPYSNDNKFDFNAVYFSMTQVYAGVPLLVDGFRNTYGLYPHFLNPLFQLIGLDVLKFSLVMSLLLGISFAMNLYVMRKFIANELILILGFASMLFFSYFVRKITTRFDCYFALFPIRYIIPSTLLFLTTIYLYRPSQKLYWMTSAVMGLFVLWNPEIGIVCYLSWFAVNIYRDFYNGDSTINVRAIARHILACVGIMLVTFYGYKFLIYAVYGAMPDMGLLWETMGVFSRIGFMLLPMSLINPWNLFGLVVVAGVLYAIAKWHGRAVTPKACIILLFSLISLGYLFYYQGRSHNVTLVSSVSFCILLLTILGDELWRVTKRNSVLLLNGLFVVFLFLVSFSFIELVYNGEKIYGLVLQEYDKQEAAEERKFLDANSEFMIKNSEEGEKVITMCAAKFQGLYFNGSKRVTGFNVCFEDMLLNTDFARFQQVLRDSSFKVFIEPNSFYFPYMQKAAAEVAAIYEMNSAQGTMALLRKRKMQIPRLSFLNTGTDMVLYRKYNDDSAGLNNRVNDAFGIAPITLNTTFSVQVLFFSEPQPYAAATLVGNWKDETGFVINNTVNSSNYFFSVNGKGFKVPVGQYSWAYCVMNVFPDSFSVYINGALARTAPIPHAVRNSGTKLCIGNLDKYHSYYVGSISEVAIKNSVNSPEEIRNNWQVISDLLEKK